MKRPASMPVNRGSRSRNLDSEQSWLGDIQRESRSVPQDHKDVGLAEHRLGHVRQVERHDQAADERNPARRDDEDARYARGNCFARARQSALEPRSRAGCEEELARGQMWRDLVVRLDRRHPGRTVLRSRRDRGPLVPFGVGDRIGRHLAQIRRRAALGGTSNAEHGRPLHRSTVRTANGTRYRGKYLASYWIRDSVSNVAECLSRVVTRLAPLGAAGGLTLLLARSALAAYPPGTFPGAAPGGAFRTVVMSKMICAAGGSLQASYDQSSLIVQVPAAAFPRCTQVSLYAAETGVIAPLLPAGSLLLDSFAVGWAGPPTSASLTLTIYDAAIQRDAAVFETTTQGVAMITDVRVDPGGVTVSFTSPPGYVITRTTAGPSGATTGPSPAAANGSAATGRPSPGGIDPTVIAAAIAALAIAAAALVLAERWRRSRRAR
jgi:hypothetical protein